RAEPFRELFRDAESDSHDADFHSTRDEALVRYAATLRRGFARVVAARLVAPQDIAAVSVFTTKSVTAIMEKLRGQVRAADAPAAAQFLLGSDGSRTVFALDDIKTAIFNRQDRAGEASPLSPQSLDSRLALLKLFPGAVGHLAFGKYQSSNYLTPDGFMPAFGTATGT